MVLTGNHCHYLTNVLRVNIDDKIFLFNNNGEYFFSIDFISKKNISLTMIYKTEKMELPSSITSCIPLIKPDTLSRMIRQSVEMEAENIWIFNAKHSSVRHINLDRIQIIAIEALEQCGRILMPKIMFFDSLEKLIKNADFEIIYANEKTASPKNIFLDNIKINDKIGVIIGPEGGFNDDEIAILSSFRSVNLGQSILRADTALVNMLLLAKMVKNWNNSER